MNVNSATSSSVVIQPAGSSSKSLDQTAFLRLMTTQLKAQDPFDPMDNTQMVAQMAQFSSVTGISEMNITLKSIADKISAQTELLTDIKKAAAAPAADANNEGIS